MIIEDEKFRFSISENAKLTLCLGNSELTFLSFSRSLIEVVENIERNRGQAG